MQESTGSELAPVKRVRRTYSKQFKAHLIGLVKEGNQSIASIAQEHKINANLLHRWVNVAKASSAEPTTLPISVAQTRRLDRLVLKGVNPDTPCDSMT